MFINTPGNSTGGIFSRSDLTEVADLVEKRYIAVISDEPYKKFVYDGIEHISIGYFLSMEDYTFTVNTYSKSYAMTGIRVRYAQDPSEAIPRIVWLQENFASCVNGPARKCDFHDNAEPDFSMPMPLNEIKHALIGKSIVHLHWEIRGVMRGWITLNYLFFDWDAEDMHM